MANQFLAEDIAGPEEQQEVYDAIEAAITAASAVGAAAQVTASAAQPKTGNTFTVATLPAAATNVGRVVYVSDGAAGSAGAAISDGSAWKVIAIGATAATS